MKTGDYIEIHFDTGGKGVAVVDDLVFADRTCNQWENGAWINTGPRELFMSEDGTVYAEGKSRYSNLPSWDWSVGYAPAVGRAFQDRMRRLMEMENGDA